MIILSKYLKISKKLSGSDEVQIKFKSIISTQHSDNSRINKHIYVVVDTSTIGFEGLKDNVYLTISCDMTEPDNGCLQDILNKQLGVNQKKVYDFIIEKIWTHQNIRDLHEFEVSSSNITEKEYSKNLEKLFEFEKFILSIQCFPTQPKLLNKFIQIHLHCDSLYVRLDYKNRSYDILQKLHNIMPKIETYLESENKKEHLPLIAEVLYRWARLRRWGYLLNREDDVVSALSKSIKYREEIDKEPDKYFDHKSAREKIIYMVNGLGLIYYIIAENDFSNGKFDRCSASIQKSRDVLKKSYLLLLAGNFGSVDNKESINLLFADVEKVIDKCIKLKGNAFYDEAKSDDNDLESKLQNRVQELEHAAARDIKQTKLKEELSKLRPKESFKLNIRDFKGIISCLNYSEDCFIKQFEVFFRDLRYSNIELYEFDAEFHKQLLKKSILYLDKKKNSPNTESEFLYRILQQISVCFVEVQKCGFISDSDYVKYYNYCLNYFRLVLFSLGFNINIPREQIPQEISSEAPISTIFKASVKLMHSQNLVEKVLQTNLIDFKGPNYSFDGCDYSFESHDLANNKLGFILDLALVINDCHSKNIAHGTLNLGSIKHCTEISINQKLHRGESKRAKYKITGFARADGEKIFLIAGELRHLDDFKQQDIKALGSVIEALVVPGADDIIKLCKENHITSLGVIQELSMLLYPKTEQSKLKEKLDYIYGIADEGGGFIKKILCEYLIYSYHGLGNNKLLEYEIELLNAIFAGDEILDIISKIKGQSKELTDKRKYEFYAQKELDLLFEMSGDKDKREQLLSVFLELNSVYDGLENGFQIYAQKGFTNHGLNKFFLDSICHDADKDPIGFIRFAYDMEKFYKDNSIEFDEIRQLLKKVKFKESIYNNLCSELFGLQNAQADYVPEYTFYNSDRLRSLEIINKSLTISLYELSYESYRSIITRKNPSKEFNIKLQSWFIMSKVFLDQCMDFLVKDIWKGNIAKDNYFKETKFDLLKVMHTCNIKPGNEVTKNVFQELSNKPDNGFLMLLVKSGYLNKGFTLPEEVIDMSTLDAEHPYRATSLFNEGKVDEALVIWEKHLIAPLGLKIEDLKKAFEENVYCSFGNKVKVFKDTDHKLLKQLVESKEDHNLAKYNRVPNYIKNDITGFKKSVEINTPQEKYVTAIKSHFKLKELPSNKLLSLRENGKIHLEKLHQLRKENFGIFQDDVDAFLNHLTTYQVEDAFKTEFDKYPFRKYKSFDIKATNNWDKFKKDLCEGYQKIFDILVQYRRKTIDENAAELIKSISLVEKQDWFIALYQLANDGKHKLSDFKLRLASSLKVFEICFQRDNCKKDEIEKIVRVFKTTGTSIFADQVLEELKKHKIINDKHRVSQPFDGLPGNINLNLTELEKGYLEAVLHSKANPQDKNYFRRLSIPRDLNKIHEFASNFFSIILRYYKKINLPQTLARDIKEAKLENLPSDFIFKAEIDKHKANKGHIIYLLSAGVVVIREKIELLIQKYKLTLNQRQTEIFDELRLKSNNIKHSQLLLKPDDAIDLINRSKDLIELTEKGAKR